MRFNRIEIPLPKSDCEPNTSQINTFLMTSQWKPALQTRINEGVLSSEEGKAYAQTILANAASPDDGTFCQLAYAMACVLYKGPTPQAIRIFL